MSFDADNPLPEALQRDLLELILLELKLISTLLGEMSSEYNVDILRKGLQNGNNQ